MQEPPLPENEAARLEALHALNLLYTPAEDRFDRITRLACRVRGVPTSLIVLVDRDCQWFKSAQGLEATETPRAVSFCGHAILGDDPMVVPDARLDPRFADNPLVEGPPFLRFYAGHPLQLDGEMRVGTLCVIDYRPRRLSTGDRQALRDLAAWASSELRLSALSEVQRDLIAERDHLRRKAMVDSLTRIWNREAVLEVLSRETARSERESGRMCVILSDIDLFKRVNDEHGHATGDDVLRSVARVLRAAIRPYDAVGRIGGEEFLIVLSDCDAAEGHRIAERIRSWVEAEEYPAPEGPVRVTLSMGVASREGSAAVSASALMEAADAALYRAKAAGRNRVETGSAASSPRPAPRRRRRRPPARGEGRRGRVKEGGQVR